MECRCTSGLKDLSEDKEIAKGKNRNCNEKDGLDKTEG
jgi:hypothetical protein